MARSYSPQAIALATREIEQITGQRVRYSGGSWYLAAGTGTATAFYPVPPNSPQGRAFERVLQQKQAQIDAQRSRSGSGAGSGAGGSSTSIGGRVGAVVGGALGGSVGASLGGTVGDSGQKLGVALGAAAGKILKVATGVAVGIVGAAVGAAIVSIKSSLDESRKILAIAQSSGLSLGAASNARANSAAFGIDSDALPGLKQNAYVQRNLSRAYGVRGEIGSQEYLQSFAQQYQQKAARGPLGLMRAQNMARSLGMEEAIPFANLPQNIRNRQFARSQQMQSSLGMKPEEVRRAQQDLVLLMASWSQFIGLVKARIGAELIPFLTQKLDQGIAYVSAHAGDISAFLKKGLGWLIDEMPPLILQAGAYAARGIGIVLSGIESLTGTLVSNLPEVLGVIQTIYDAGKTMFSLLAGAAGGALEIAKNLIKPGVAKETAKGAAKGLGWGAVLGGVAVGGAAFAITKNPAIALQAGLWGARATGAIGAWIGGKRGYENATATAGATGVMPPTQPYNHVLPTSQARSDFGFGGLKKAGFNILDPSSDNERLRNAGRQRGRDFIESPIGQGIKRGHNTAEGLLPDIDFVGRFGKPDGTLANNLRRAGQWSGERAGDANRLADSLEAMAREYRETRTTEKQKEQETPTMKIQFVHEHDGLGNVVTHTKAAIVRGFRLAQQRS